jgi:hypothetical protein
MTCGEHDPAGHSQLEARRHEYGNACHRHALPRPRRPVIVLTGFPVFSLGVPR